MATCSDLIVTKWGAHFKGRRFRCAIGHGGIGVKQAEGDGITPRGRFAIRNIFFRPDRIAQGRGQSIPLNAVWSDDPVDPAYNTLQVAWSYPYSHERMRRPDPLYDIVVDLDFNRETPKPGKGSAIFLHVWRRPRYPTAGCIAFAKPDLLWILHHWSRTSHVAVS